MLWYYCFCFSLFCLPLLLTLNSPKWLISNAQFYQENDYFLALQDLEVASKKSSHSSFCSEAKCLKRNSYCLTSAILFCELSSKPVLITFTVKLIFSTLCPYRHTNLLFVSQKFHVFTDLRLIVSGCLTATVCVLPVLLHLLPNPLFNYAYTSQ